MFVAWPRRAQKIFLGAWANTTGGVCDKSVMAWKAPAVSSSRRLALIVAALAFLAFSVQNCGGHAGEGVHHGCVHSELVEPKLSEFMRNVMGISLEAHRGANDYTGAPLSRRLLADLGEPAPLRIKVDYQLGALEAEKATFVKDKLIPAMVGVLRRNLNIRKPVQGSLKLPHLCTTVFSQFPDYCLAVSNSCGTATHNPEFMSDWRICTAPYESQCTSHEGGPGAEDADFVLYVTASLEEACVPPYTAVASGGFCSFDIDNWYGLPNRPLAGIANLCPNRISTAPEDFGYMLDTAVHEVLHALVMSRTLMDNFIDEDGNKRTETVSVEDGVAKIVTPAVKKQIRDMFDCDELDGARLEDEGGSGTAGSHWESRMFMGEIMVGNSLGSTRDILSNVTMALAEDSGWYMPNYDRAGLLANSYKKGCGFVKEDCKVPSTTLEGTFCWNNSPPNEQPNVCTSDHTAIGYCRTGLQLMGGCNVIQPFQNTDCTNPAHDRYGAGRGGLSVDMGTRHKPGARCFPVASQNLRRANGFVSSYIQVTAACFSTTCKNGKVYIQIPATQNTGAKEIACPEGQTVDLEQAGIGYREGVIGPCPSPETICPGLGCPGDCNRNGQCLDGTCRCHVGFDGDDCTLQACQEGSCPGGFKCNLLLGRCESVDSPPVRKSGISPGPSEKPKASEAEVPQSASPSVPAEPTAPVSRAPKPAVPAVPAVPAGPASPASGAPVPELPLPVVPEEPIPQNTSAPEVPLLPPTEAAPTGTGSGEEDSTEVVVSGKAVWNGYLAGCAVFSDLDGDLQWDQEEPGVLTTIHGDWSFSAPRGVEIVVDHSRSSCRDVFTGLRPRWVLRAPFGSSYISPLTSLFTSLKRTATVAMTLHGMVDDPDSGSTFQGDVLASTTPGQATGDHDIPVGDAQRVWVDAQMLAGLGLDQEQVVEEDVVWEVGAEMGEKEERAVILSVVLANTVTQVAAFETGSTDVKDKSASGILEVVGEMLVQDSFQIEELADSGEMLKIIQSLRNKKPQASAEAQEAVAKTVALTNQIAFRAAKSYDGIILLERLTRLGQVAQGRFAELAAKLKNNQVDVNEYSQLTSKSNLDQEMKDAEVAVIWVALGLPSEPDHSTRKHFTYLDFEHSAPALFAVVILALSMATFCCWCCTRKHRSPARYDQSAAQGAQRRQKQKQQHPARAPEHRTRNTQQMAKSAGHASGLGTFNPAYGYPSLP